MKKSQQQNRFLLPPAVQREKNIAESWKQVFNTGTNSRDGERNDKVNHISRKRRLDNADSHSRDSDTTRRVNNFSQQKSRTAMNDELSDRTNINFFGRNVKVTFNVCRISKHRDEGGRRKARITWKKLIYLLPYNDILFLQNRHAILRLQEGLLGKEALTNNGTKNRYHWRDKITNRDIHLILEAHS